MSLPKHKTLPLLMAIVISLTLVPMIATAAEADTAGNCAANVTKTITDLKERKTAIEKSLTDSASAKRLTDFESQIKAADSKRKVARQKYLDELGNTLKNNPNLDKDPTPNTPFTELDALKLSKAPLNSRTRDLFDAIELKKFVQGGGINNRDSSWLTQLIDGLKKQETVRKSESQKVIKNIDSKLADLEVLAQARKIANEVGIYPNGCFYLLSDGTVGVRITGRGPANLTFTKWTNLYNKFTQSMASKLGARFQKPKTLDTGSAAGSTSKSQAALKKELEIKDSERDSKWDKGNVGMPSVPGGSAGM